MAINQSPPFISVPLSAFLGLYTEASAVDLPEGASPLTWDTDFIVGSALMRPGIQNAYSFAGGGAGPNFCQSGSDVSLGLNPWANPGNITAHDGSYATVTPDQSVVSQKAPSQIAGLSWTNPANLTSLSAYATTPTGSSNYIVGTTCGFAIPSGAVIKGISVSVKAYDSLVSGRNLTAALCLNGAVISTNSKTQNITNSPAVYNFGSGSDLWGLTWTPAQINSNTFGIAFQSPAVGPPASTTSLNSASVTVYYTVTGSDELLAKTFGFSIPAGAINGIQIIAFGHATGPVTLTAQLMSTSGLVGMTRTATLPIAALDQTVFFGSNTDNWGAGLTQAQINNTSFGVVITAAGIGEAFIDYVSCIVTQVAGSYNFDWIKTFAQRSGQLSTLALDANGTLWDENVTSDPGVLTSIYSPIQPNMFGKSVTLDDVEYIGLSNLLSGVDMPRQWTGQWLDRISQVGPGSPPTVAVTSTTYPIVASPLGITQATAKSDPTNPGSFHAATWSVGPGSTAIGNVITIYYATTVSEPADPDIIVGNAIVLAGMPVVGAANPNGTYIVNSIGSGIPPVPGAVQSCWYFTVTATTQFKSHAAPVAGTYQVTLATLTTTTPLPNTQVGSQLTVAGAGVASWDATWTVLYTPNSAQLEITATSLAANQATYDYTLITGTAPTVGQQVTVNGCLNGPVVGGTSIFNVFDGIISGVGTGYFTIDLTYNGSISSAAETGNALVNGTIFQFDPGLSLVGSMTSPIFGNSGGGTVVIIGQGLGAGIRQAVVMFLTRNGAITAPSVPITFTTPGGATGLVFTNIPIGPPNIIGRVIALTGANGSQFYYQDVATTIHNGGQTITYSATVINDNVSTQATFTLTDTVITTGIEIDIQGNNLFEQAELGPCLGTIGYAGRLFSWGVLNKITQWINPTFDGGATQNSVGIPYPAGWTIDPTSGAGGLLVPSPLFGNSYYIQNTTGTTAAILGLITQGAFEDYYNVPIILPNTLYSLRCTARTPGSATNGILVLDLYSPSFNKVFGSASFPTSGMTSAMQIFTTTMLTTVFTTVPPDLILRIYFKNSANLEDVELDRFDIFPTLEPVLTTQVIGSYEQNFEAFDQIDGVIDTVVENQQPVRTCFTQYDELYIVKSGSMYSTRDNSTSEPEGWTLRQVSPSIGTNSVNGVDYVDSNQQGESYALIGGRAGLYLFNGGEPVQLTGDIRSLWNTINWTYEHTLWVRNDVVNRRILVGVPLPTPNQWLPNAAVNSSPTTPNVVLAMSYREVNSISELEDRATVRASTFTGKLIATDISRKWSIWQIQSPYTDFVKRPNGTWPLFLGNSKGTGKIYQLTEGATDDDGAAINETYTTYGFVTAEAAQALQLGQGRKYFGNLILTTEGTGELQITVYPDTLASPYVQELQIVTLPNPGGNDLEYGTVDQEGFRLFLQFSMNAVGQSFNLSRVVMAIKQAASTILRGI